MAASSFSTHTQTDFEDVVLPPLVEVPFAAAFNSSETQNRNCISSVQARNERRKKVIDVILQKCKDGKLQHGCIKSVANDFNISDRSVRDLWRIAKAQLDTGLSIDVECRWQGNSGKKSRTKDFSKLSQIPFHQRQTLRAVSHCLNVSTTTAHRWLKEKKIKRHSNAIKPFLCEKGKLKRLKYCLSFISPTSLPNPTFHHCYDYIHIDEKWFNLSKPKATFYTLPGEDDPYRITQSKTHIPKIIFLAAVGRPRFEVDGEVIWDGKIGIFPFTFEEAAKRASKNRPAGTMEIKAVPKIARDVMRSMMIQQLLPAIRAKWPGTSKQVIIQQDNAKPHIDINDLEFVSASKEGDWDIQLQFQPPNSPDLNVLDLGFFRSIDALSDKTAPRSMRELITNVTMSYDQLIAQTLNNVFLTYQEVMSDVLKQKGGNDYKIPHMGKERLAREGLLPENIHVDAQVYEEVVQFSESNT
ncbi:unnamed protein product [Cuscuta campestris]|uniref:DUF7769 domain-containing protein n=1 Tax=Cuscuta campestris TaxID=132261 RepID=A0A484LSD1_9ASTE|nr:unnamed protein product [Cuscuta campestris]